MTRTDREWVAVHAFQHDGQDQMIVDLVRPLVAEMTRKGRIDDAFILRYWEGGPHLRVRARPTSADDGDAVLAELVEALESWCVDHPVEQGMSEAEYARLVERLAVPTEEPTLQPVGSVQARTYHPEHDRYGTGDVLARFERHFCESSYLAMDLLASGLTPAGAQALAVQAIGDVHRRDPSEGPSWAGRVIERLPAQPSARTVQTVSDIMDRPSVWLDRWHESWMSLLTAIRTDFAKDYHPPRTGFCGVDFGGREAAPMAAIDICAHLFCNRIGVTIPDEIRLRGAVGHVLMEGAA